MTETTVTPTTEAEAINMMLGVLGETPLTDIDDELSVDAVNAKNDLLAITRSVQTPGWTFNTEYDFPLPPNEDGEILLPLNCVTVDVDRVSSPDIDPVVRGKRLYDRKNHTYTFNKTLKAEIVILLSFEELPEYARWYVAVRASRWYQEHWFGSSELASFTRDDERRAYEEFKKAEESQGDYNILWGKGLAFNTFTPGLVLRRR